MGSDRRHFTRTRWAAIGAAIAVTFGGGAVFVADAATSPGAASFVPITPCRLVDTRSQPPIGQRTTAIGAHETVNFTVRGANGDCVISSTATGIALNVTTLNGTAASFLSVWPSDVTRPNASTNNWQPGPQAIPNKVDVKLSATGGISVYNESGTVDLLVDVVGYYEPVGIAGYEVVNKASSVGSNTFKGDSVECPAGKKPLSGNYTLTSSPTFGALRMVQSQITANGWGVQLENVGVGSAAVTFNMQVVCATAG
jgi:hypothetical protein